MFRNPDVRRNVADNIRREHAIPAEVSDLDILSLHSELIGNAGMSSDEFRAYLGDELERCGSWPAVVEANPLSVYA
jgi:hypothetical protein